MMPISLKRIKLSGTPSTWVAVALLRNKVRGPKEKQGLQWDKVALEQK